MGRQQVKHVMIDMRNFLGARKLNRYLKRGWVVQSQQKRGMFEWNPGQTDFTLTREVGRKPVVAEVYRVVETQTEPEAIDGIPPSTWLPSR